MAKRRPGTRKGPGPAAADRAGADRTKAPAREKGRTPSPGRGISNRSLGEEQARQQQLPPRGTKEGGERPKGGTTSGTRKKQGRGES